VFSHRTIVTTGTGTIWTDTATVIETEADTGTVIVTGVTGMAVIATMTTGNSQF
jgi:hypothetical protein